MKIFTNELMFEIILYLKDSLSKSNEITFRAINPNLANGIYCGEKIIYDDKEYVYHSFKSWCDLSEILFCKINILNLDDNLITIKFIKLDNISSFHSQNELKKEKYGKDSIFFRINKNEEPAFLNYYLSSLKSIKIQDKKKILNLGINKGDEFDIIKKIIPNEKLNEIEFYGVDYSNSAIEFSKNRFPNENFNFFCHDINRLKELNLPKIDCLISIGTLQSSSLNFKALFMDIFQNILEDKASIILGFPNCRWVDGEMIYGAKAPNYSYSELSILFNDIIFCKKYLQQKKYRVTITGKNYIFLTAISIKN